jgi:hypothetical protein
LRILENKRRGLQRQLNQADCPPVRGPYDQD